MTRKNLRSLSIKLTKAFPVGLAAPEEMELITFSCPYIQSLKTAQRTNDSLKILHKSDAAWL